MANAQQSQQNLVQPPQIPTSIIMAQGENKELMTIYAQIINSERIMYKNALRKLYSADWQEVPNYMDVPDESGNIQHIPNPETKIIKLPSSRKICLNCNRIYSEGDVNYDICYHCNIKPKYLEWKPTFNENGFNGIISSILTGTDEIMSTGNVIVDQTKNKSKKEETLSLKLMAYESIVAINDTITENIMDWSATGEPNITEGQFYRLDQEMFDHFYFTMTRSKEAYLLERMAQTSSVAFSNPGQKPSESEREQKRGLGEMLFGPK